ncbi:MULTISPECIES: F0F1 ATP synthase subunit delta [unclassified Agromyces]|uniref:F0F1 ATP synthase subunit delta n=1 Tax=unclassified Agromyces TaxID=2639701 RepID=UPI0007B1D5E6|nr:MULTISPECIES: F0F1 ATP synthase subunit delta [unclassified Agromyces]KZE94210.1 ATP synthase subunit delta [Agromyces sp. NDB4Y10]MCK8608778.1 F0F1 ATP synthase subunit delta [Agromyces sp. C10]
MGSATRGALAGTRAELATLGRAELPVAGDLLAATRVIGATPQLRTALTDNEAGPDQKRALVERVFGGRLQPAAAALLVSAASQRWSSAEDFLGGLEDLGLRVAAEAAGESVEVDAELYAFQRAVASDAELELALGSKLGSTDAKVRLVERLLAPRASAATTMIVGHLVQQPRGRRIGEMLRHAASVVADQRGFDVATVTSAVPLTDDQVARLERTLGSQAGRRIRFDSIVDPEVLGGVRVQIGDDVIDGSVASRLNDLRQQLAG